MSNIINLKRARKRLKRVEKEAIAEQNRLTYGQPKEIRAHTMAETDKRDKLLDNARLSDSDRIDG